MPRTSQASEPAPLLTFRSSERARVSGICRRPDTSPHLVIHETLRNARFRVSPLPDRRDAACRLAPSLYDIASASQRRTVTDWH